MFKKLQKHASEVLEFPPDVLDNGPKITIMGRKEIRVEHFQEVIVFSEQEIVLKTTEGKLALKGNNFVLNMVLQTEIQITGLISQLSFEED